MSVDKKISYEKDKPAIQGGVENYLGRQPEVQAPRKWKSSPDKPETELAYITKAEKDLILKANIHGGLEKGPNMGPSGIMSLDSFGDIGGAGAAGADTAASGEAMAGRGFSGIGPNESRQDFANRKDAQRAALQRAEKAQADRLGYRERQNIANFKSKTPSPFGPRNIVSGILSALTGPIGFATNLGTIFGDSLQNLREKLTGYSTQEDYEKARQDRINQQRIDNILNRDAPITEMTQKNLEKLGYTGDMPGVGSTPTSRAIARDLAINPETTQFARSYIQSLAQPDINKYSTPIGPRAVNVPGATRDITFGDVPRGFNYLDVSDEDLYGTFGRTVAPSPFSTGYKGMAPTGIQGIDVGFENPAFDNSLSADATYDQQKNILENLLNTEDTKLDESIDKKEQRQKRQQELLKMIG